MTLPESGKPSLLIVDDDPLIIDALSFYLGGEFEIAAAASRAGCIDLLRGRTKAPQLALVDLGLPPLPHEPDEGFALISDLLAHSPAIKIVVLSGQNDEANARHARALGASEFVAKPADPELLRQALRRILAFQSAELSAEPAQTEDPCGLIGDSAAMQKLRAQIAQYGDSPYPVLIEGESGSGKEIVASCCLHRLTARRDKPYFALNCAAISPALLEPTLFGYAKGAFTGAVQAKSGYFEDTEDGTLFLDEIGELPLELQPKLLRVLENGEFQRVGETQLRRSRARVIAATNRDLRREVREGRFRADLYHRLSVFAIAVPPLREMGDDKLLLLRHYRAFYSKQSGQPPFELSEAALARWQDYAFPGNVRELRNIVIRLVTKHPGHVVDVEALEAELDTDAGQPPGDWLPPRSADELSALALRHLQQRGQFSLDDTLLRWEQGYIQAALKLTHGNVSQAARLLGINRTTLYNRMEVLARHLDAARQGETS
ncbi:MAG TPA: sigma-54 dependent transcriptional regulator [Candidatus Desulfobacillus sp.]|nr:sigma-54 dependent transcriptional regulator [Candidatus Desulfobacillus sp.]